MKYVIVDLNKFYFKTYFRTKREAKAYLEEALANGLFEKGNMIIESISEYNYYYSKGQR